MILARFWEARGPPKIEKNPKKSIFFDFLTCSVLKEGCGRVLGGFGYGFGRILGAFWMDFLKILRRIFDEKLRFWEFKFKLQNFWFSGWILQTMIRATKGKSMDGWRRPNHMHSHLDALPSMPSVNFR